MRRVLVLSLAALALVSLTATANATLVVKDTFTSTTGYPVNLVGHTPEIGGTWAAHSATGLSPIQIVNDNPPATLPGAAYLSQGSGSREDAHTNFLNNEVAGAGSKYWAGFCVKVTGTDPLSNVYFAHFKDSGTSNFVARVGVTDPSVTDFQVALFSASSTVGATWPTPLLYNTWHRIVTSYEFTTGLQEMWVDPNPALGPYDPGQVTPISWTGFASTAIEDYSFRQATITPTSGVSQQTIDNLAVGNNISDWPDVASPCIPEPATLSLLALGAFALLRRRT